MNETKRKVLSALSGPFVREREDLIGDLTAQIEQNARETIYRYRGEEYREPTAAAVEFLRPERSAHARVPAPCGDARRAHGGRQARLGPRRP